MLDKLVPILNALPLVIVYAGIIFVIVLYFKDKYQNQHSILKTHPILGRLRYVFEMLGPEFRQYWFLNDKEGRPISRSTQETIAKAGKYGNTVIGFGSTKDFSQSDFYLSNSMFPKNVEELQVDNSNKIQTYIYEIVDESLTARKEKRHLTVTNPWHLTDDNAIVIGPKTKSPFVVKGLVGISAMSYGALSKSAVKALAQGVAISGGSFMNTGEGGLSPYHLSKIYEVTGEKIPTIEKERVIYDYIKRKPNSSNFRIDEKFGDSSKSHLKSMVENGFIIEKHTDLIFQIGSGLFGARKNGKYCEESFLKNAMRKEVKAIEIKMAQGAKVRGGKLPKEKITPEIAEIRGVEMGKDVESPNRFPLFSNIEELFALIKNWQDLTGKPVGIKVVAGSELSFEELASHMAKTGEGPNFISIDGGEGGTGATYQEMADSLGLPIYSGLQILDNTLRKYNVRNRVIIISSGLLATADKMSIALSMGADLIYIARAAMNTIGCINSEKCFSNHCPTGVTSHLPHLEKGLAVQEKRFRTANYLTTMRQGMFMLGASCGIDSPTKFSKEHITYRNMNSETKRMDQVKTQN